MSTQHTAIATLLWRYPDLVERGIVRNRETLRRWIDSLGFPKPIPLGPNSIAWKAEDVEAWIESRAKDSAA